MRVNMHLLPADTIEVVKHAAIEGVTGEFVYVHLAQTATLHFETPDSAIAFAEHILRVARGPAYTSKELLDQAFEASMAVQR
jgi:hypothetical protein